MRLPALLQPWSAMLTLLPAELAATLGDMLLRLDPLFGPLRRHAAPQAVEPAGIGDVVRRGSYERLLIGEWALADAAPDEFLRRAAQGELLFTGPEPASSQRPLRSIALFDAGPAQLGQPRLAHLALFILLARRAEAAGAAFQWGVLQRPGSLYENADARALQHLIDARTHSLPSEAGLALWNTVLDGTADDCWLVGDAGTVGPAPVRARALVRHGWLADALEVTLAEAGRTRSVTLPLPSPDDGVRLLRRPFDAPARAAGGGLRAGAHSLKRPPLFGDKPEWVAVALVDGSIAVYHVPASLQSRPGRPRNAGRPPHAESVVAAGLCDKSLGTIALRQETLTFANFSGPFFHRHDDPGVPLPDPDLFEALAGALRWAPVFHLKYQHSGKATERVLVLDKAGHLACWTREGRVGSHRFDGTRFELVARNVVGAVQDGNRVLFAVGGDGRTDAYALANDQARPAHLYPLMHAGDRFLFGAAGSWRGGRGMYALRLDAPRPMPRTLESASSPQEWLVGETAGAERVHVEPDAVVLGCATAKAHGGPGLVVLDAGRTRISLRAAGRRSVLVESSEPIAQASFDPLRDRLAWIGQKSGTLTVRGIDQPRPFLQTVTKGETDGG